MNSYADVSNETLTTPEENFQFSEEERVEAQLMCLQVMEGDDF
ncbi:MAG: hypothetical protein V7731_02640 [Amphritea sp.]